MNRKLALLAAAVLAFPLIPSAFAENNMPCVVQGGTELLPKRNDTRCPPTANTVFSRV